jgi:hypothetical protein
MVLCVKRILTCVLCKNCTTPNVQFPPPSVSTPLSSRPSNFTPFCEPRHDAVARAPPASLPSLPRSRCRLRRDPCSTAGSEGSAVVLSFGSELRRPRPLLPPSSATSTVSTSIRSSPSPHTLRGVPHLSSPYASIAGKYSICRTSSRLI